MLLLLTADLHIRPDVPKCRTDDFLKMQKETLDFIYKTAYECKAKVIVAGDIFDSAQPRKSQELEYFLQTYFIKENSLTAWIAGNHDVINGNYNNCNKTSLGVLEALNTIHGWNSNHGDKCFINYCNYGEIKQNTKLPITECSIMLQHIYCTQYELPYYIENGITASQLLYNYPEYDLFITGDNHHGFCYEENNRFVINPGCITRQKGDMKDYRPRVYLFDTVKKSAELIYLPDNKVENVSNLHNKEKKKRSKQLDKFIKSMNNSNRKMSSLKDDIQEFCKINNVNNGITDYLFMSIENDSKEIINKLNDYWENTK